MSNDFNFDDRQSQRPRYYHVNNTNRQVGTFAAAFGETMGKLVAATLFIVFVIAIAIGILSLAHRSEYNQTDSKIQERIEMYQQKQNRR